MKLGDQQELFMRNLPPLLLKAFELGFEIRGGDLFRDPRSTYGSKSSKHHRKLAIDLNLTYVGEYLTETSDHQCLGQWWESIGGIWGGRFEDGNHYEAPDNGLWVPHLDGEDLISNVTIKKDEFTAKGKLTDSFFKAMEKDLLSPASLENVQIETAQIADLNVAELGKVGINISADKLKAGTITKAPPFQCEHCSLQYPHTHPGESCPHPDCPYDGFPHKAHEEKPND